MKALIITALFATLTANSPVNNIYFLSGVYNADSQTVTDSRGEEWEFDNEEIPDESPVIITFDSNGTADIYDDGIISIVEKR